MSAIIGYTRNANLAPNMLALCRRFIYATLGDFGILRKSSREGDEGTVVSISISTKDLRYWASEIYPFILVVFDAMTESAYWLHIQEYVKRRPECVASDRDSISVHIPVSNILTVAAVEAFRNMSLRLVERLRNQGGFPDVSPKPR